MKSGKCPKCGSQNIYSSHNNTQRPTFGNFIFVKMGFFRHSGVLIEHYTCDDCNYLESYVRDESKQTVRDEWISLNPRKSKRKNDET